MRKGSKVIKIKYEEDSIFVGAAWGRKRTRWGRKGARLTLEAISDYLKKGAGVHSEEAYLDEVKCDLLRLIRKRLYQQALKDGKEIKEYECSFEGVVIWPGKNKFICFTFFLNFYIIKFISMTSLPHGLTGFSSARGIVWTF